MGVNMESYTDVRFTYGRVHVKGSFLKTPMSVTAKRIPVGRELKWFVKMSTSEAWLVKATTGQNKHSHSSFGRTSLLPTLREKVNQVCNGEGNDVIEGQASEEDEEVAEGENEGEYDPMNELDLGAESCVTPKKTRGRGTKRVRYYHNRAKDRIFVTNMPKHCPEKAPDCKERCKITMYVEDRKTIWLCIDDVEWAIRYLYVQHILKGVPLVSPDSQGPSSDG